MSMPEPETVTVEVEWSDVEAIPILLGNVFMVNQTHEHEFVLTIGQLAPVIVGATLEEKQRRIREAGKLPIRTLGRFALTDMGRPDRFAQRIAATLR